MSENSEALEKAKDFFLQYIDEIQKNKISDVSIRRALKKYDVKNLKINNVTPLRAKKMYQAIIPKYSSGATTEKSWLENQRRLFIWCSLCYLHKNGLDVRDLKLDDFQFLRRMFPLKELNLIKFQIYSLVKKDNKNSSWEEQEDDLLRQLVNKENLVQIEWSNISKQFFIKSKQNYFRNAKQCRQRWLNHLDPNKVKGKWQPEQDIVLLNSVLQKGKKWSKIVEALDGKKNQHMIKNRYKSLIHKKQKSSKNSKMKQNQLIKLILKQYNQGNREEVQEIQEQNSQQQDQQINSKIEASEDQQKQAKPALTRNQSPAKNQQSLKPTNFKKRCQNWPIIVQPKHPEQIAQPSDANGNAFIKNQVQLCGDNADRQFVNNLFYNVSTPVAEDNRIPPIILQNRSPAPGVFLSPFPACWTPTIFLVEDQGQPSPQIGFGNFSSTAKGALSSFLSGEQRR